MHKSLLCQGFCCTLVQETCYPMKMKFMPLTSCHSILIPSHFLFQLNYFHVLVCYQKPCHGLFSVPTLYNHMSHTIKLSTFKSLPLLLAVHIQEWQARVFFWISICINSFCTICPLQLVKVRLSEHSRTVVMQVMSTDIIIPLADFYYLVINYNHILTYNKHCN